MLDLPTGDDITPFPVFARSLMYTACASARERTILAMLRAGNVEVLAALAQGASRFWHLNYASQDAAHGSLPDLS